MFYCSGFLTLARILMLLMVQISEQVPMTQCVHMHRNVCVVCLTSVSPRLSSCGGDVCWSRFPSWSSSSRPTAQSARLARWVRLISINCGNATQPLAALCRNNQIITCTLSQREACGPRCGGWNNERSLWHLLSYCIILSLLYFHSQFRLLAKFLTAIIQLNLIL